MKKPQKIQAAGLVAQKKQGGRTRALFNTGTRPMEDKSKYSRKTKHRHQDEGDAFYFLTEAIRGPGRHRAALL